MTFTQRIGNPDANFWAYAPDTGHIDLSRGTSEDGQLLTLQTTTNPVRFNPASTALIIIDMQNFFLCPALRRQSQNTPTAAENVAQVLLETGIPAARRHQIRVVWLNWGLTKDDLACMPPGLVRTFGVYSPVHTAGETRVVSAPANMLRVKNRSLYRGLGTDLGVLDIGNDESVDGGRVLMRDTWNAALYPPLEKEYKHSFASNTPLRDPSRDAKPDVVIYKNRMSGLWGPSTDLEEFLKREGITTLLFAGVNTDQCVGGTLMDAFSKGYDCILLRDGVATSSPSAANEAWEYNCMNCWGFVTSCEALQKAQ